MKTVIDKAEVDRLVKERLEEEKKAYVPLIETKYGNTYISFRRYDYYTETCFSYLLKLFDLMRIEYARYIPNEHESYLMIHGDDKDRAAFIQKFIDNGYILSWK